VADAYDEEMAAVFRDAARYRLLRSKVSGGYSMPGSPASFQLPLIPPVGNIMKGSVAQHFDAAIDAACGVKVPEPTLLQRAYEAGWVQCATWAERDDLITDCDSGAYTRERDAALAKLTNGVTGTPARLCGEPEEDYLERTAKPLRSAAVHFDHCYQGEYAHSCKYGDTDCPAAHGVAVMEPSGSVQCKQCLAITNKGNGCAAEGCPIGVEASDKARLCPGCNVWVNPGTPCLPEYQRPGCINAGVSVGLIPPDAITVNLVRLAGLNKHKARECEAIVRQVLAAHGVLRKIKLEMGVFADVKAAEGRDGRKEADDIRAALAWIDSHLTSARGVKGIDHQTFSEKK
jgi:hypothetical protein